MEVELQEISQDKQKLIELWKAAHIDPLTKLLNRYGTEQRINESLNTMDDTRRAVLVIIDVDNFKYVNDTFGHMLGDAVLEEIAEMINEIFPQECVKGRIGGDEFLIYMDDVEELSPVCDQAERLCDEVKRRYQQKRQEYGLSLSIGIASSRDNRTRYNSLFKEVDVALYNAKAKGKNRCEIYSGSMTHTMPGEERQNAAQVEQIGSSGFSATKILLDEVIDILNEEPDPKTMIERVARRIVEVFDVTRAYASCYTRDEMHIGKSYFYAQDSDENITPNLALSGREYEQQCFNSDGIFFCIDIEETPEPIRTELRRMKVQTLLQVLIYQDDRIIGTLGLNNCGYKRLWMQSEIEVIHTIGKLMTPHILRLQESMEEDEPR